MRIVSIVSLWKLLSSFLFILFSLQGLFSLEGISYASLNQSSYLSYLIGSQSVHILEVDPSLYEIKPVKALDNGIGRETVLSIAKRYGAIASINGGFFSTGGSLDGKASGALKIGNWYALPTKPRACIGWSSDQPLPIIDRLLVDLIGYCNGSHFQVNGLNRSRKIGEMVLFNPLFHRTTLTHPDGEELIIVKSEIDSIVPVGSSLIPHEGSILSIQETHPFFHKFEVGMSLEFSYLIQSVTGNSDPNIWNKLDYIVGGTPILIQNKKKVVDFTPELTLNTFLFLRHARTAIGILPDGHWLFVIVDKNNWLDGATISELANLMEELGCVEALNLDGGGSSTLVYKGTVRNCPSGDEVEEDNSLKLRRVSDAIIILPKPSDTITN